MKKLSVLMLVSALLVAFTLGVEAQTTIRFVKWPGANYDPERDPDQIIVNEFNRLHSDIQVELAVIPNYFEALLVQMTGGIYPDVLKVNPTMISEFKPLGLLEELSPYLERSPGLTERLWPIATSSAGVHGGLYAMPISLQPDAVYYNISAFDQAGLASPNLLYERNDWHWGTFLESAKRLTIDTNGDGASDVFGYKGSSQNWPIFVESARGKLYTEDGKQLLVDEAAMDALEFLASLIHEHRVWTTRAPYYTEAFPQGLAAMIIAGARYVNIYRDDSYIEWDVAPVFGRTADMPFQPKVRLGGLSIAAMSDKKEAGWKLIEHFLEVDSQLVYAESGEVPMNGEAASSRAFLDPSKPPEHMSVFLDTLSRAIPNTDPVVPTSVTNALNTELNKVWNRGEPVRAVIENARPIINAMLAELQP